MSNELANIKPMTAAEFEQLMQNIADGWNEGNPRKAADCFSMEAIYCEPPQKQLYHGRHELYEFFGGDKGTDIPMKMTWHHWLSMSRIKLALENIPLKCMDVIMASWW